MSTHPTYRLTWRGAQSGPFSLAEIRQKLAHGELNSMYQIHVDGRWMTLRDFLESDAAHQPAAAAPAQSYQPAPPVQTAWQQEAPAARDSWGVSPTTAAQPPPMPAMTLSPAHGGERKSRRFPIWAWSAAAALLLVAATGAVMLFTGGGTREEKDHESPQESVPDPSMDADRLALQEAIRLYEGVDITQDIPAAVAIFKKYAEMGNPTGQLYFGRAIYEGNGMPLDLAAGAAWIEKSAQQGLPESQCRMGIFHLAGKGVAQDPVKAVEWLTKAAMMGHRRAQCALGMCYLQGVGVKVDIVHSYAWFEVCAGGGNAEISSVLEEMAGKMSRAQLADAFRIAQDIKSKLLSDPSMMNMPESLVESNWKSMGTGFFITTDGYFITNHHVVDKATVVKVRTSAGIQNATIVEMDHANDLALLKLTGKFDAVPVISSKDVVLGNTVATVGFPTIQLLGSAPKLGKGEVTALAGTRNAQRFFQISLPLQPGNSGGALVDERGNVIGVVAAKLTVEAMMEASGTLPENINYAIKSVLVLDLIKRVPGLSDQLVKPYTGERKFETVVKDLQKAAAMILVF